MAEPDHDVAPDGAGDQPVDGATDHFSSWQPLEAHTPRTTAEAGLEPARHGRAGWKVAGGIVLVAALVTLGVLVMRGEGASTLVDLDAGACYTPVVTSVDDAVTEETCGPGVTRLLTRERHPGGAGDVHPGDGALELFGQGACQGLVEPDALVIAVPSPSSWAAGERVVACSERL